MIIYKSKYFDDNKENDNEISSKDRLKVAGAGLGAGGIAGAIKANNMAKKKKEGDFILLLFVY